MRLVEDARSAYRWLSVQLAAASVIAMQVYENVPQFQQYIPDKVFHNVMTVMVGLIIIGRLIKQEPAPVEAPKVP